MTKLIGSKYQFFTLSLKIQMSQKNHFADNWVDLYFDFMFFVAKRYVKEVDLAKDLVQDTFLAALEGYDAFDGKADVKTWLVAILKNKVFNHYRKNKQKTTLSFTDFEGENGDKPIDFFKPTGGWNPDLKPNEFTFNFEQEEVEKLTDEYITECINKLPPAWKLLLEEKFFQEESTSEDICERLNLSKSNFWVIFHRTKLVLRNCLEPKLTN